MTIGYYSKKVVADFCMVVEGFTWPVLSDALGHDGFGMIDSFQRLGKSITGSSREAFSKLAAIRPVRGKS